MYVCMYVLHVGANISVWVYVGIHVVYMYVCMHMDVYV